MRCRRVKLKAKAKCLWCCKKIPKDTTVWKHRYLIDSTSYIHIKCRPAWKSFVETTATGRVWLRDFVTVEVESPERAREPRGTKR